MSDDTDDGFSGIVQQPMTGKTAAVAELLRLGREVLDIRREFKDYVRTTDGRLKSGAATMANTEQLHNNHVLEDTRAFAALEMRLEKFTRDLVDAAKREQAARDKEQDKAIAGVTDVANPRLTSLTKWGGLALSLLLIVINWVWQAGRLPTAEQVHDLDNRIHTLETRTAIIEARQVKP